MASPAKAATGAGGGGEPVDGDDGVVGVGVADVPGDADCQAGDGGGPGPDPLPCGPPVEVGDAKREFSDGEEDVGLGGPGHGLPAAQAVVDGPVVQSGVAVGELLTGRVAGPGSALLCA